MPPFQIAVIPVTVFQQNCSLLWETGSMRAAIVDPGGEPGKILDTVDRMGLKVELVLLTHGHLDHAGGAKALKGVLDEARANSGLPPVPLLGPDERDRFLLEGIEEAQKAFGMTGLRNVLPDRWLAEGDTVELGALRFEVLHVPGHTPGHIVFVEQTQRFAFTGDTIFKGSVGRTDFPYGDSEALLSGIKQKLLPLGDDMTFICGHGPASSIGSERQTNPFLQD
ncbi:MBL fold metallo-hydrolase [Limobrevibacterium gyesilva]|uniref:MBL fold metallo-hydrolase n=1 Tax=Limobrevibacterium gyesilva TaxID=2991712 RepID=A0AA41YNR9_9PROT|nr:MBL fold metallo-hydrolase [Limobrevibacterium gyesilva]MCW3476100.1 MBL fold metallo-hydrolase [Limobrevibacterium gyesilva]